MTDWFLNKPLYNTLSLMFHCTKNEVFIKVLSSKCNQIRGFLRIRLHLLEKSLMENFIFCVSISLVAPEKTRDVVRSSK